MTGNIDLMQFPVVQLPKEPYLEEFRRQSTQPGWAPDDRVWSEELTNIVRMVENEAKKDPDEETFDRGAANYFSTLGTMGLLYAVLGPLALAVGFFRQETICLVKIVNALPVDLKLAGSGLYINKGLQFIEPATIAATHLRPGADPKSVDPDDYEIEYERKNEVPAAVEGMVSVAYFGFQKNLDWPVPMAGTSGALAFVRAGGLPAGFYSGWELPLSGKSSCAVSVNDQGTAEKHYVRWVENKSLASDSSASSGVRATCALDKARSNDAVVTCLLEPA